MGWCADPVLGCLCWSYQGNWFSLPEHSDSLISQSAAAFLPGSAASAPIAKRLDLRRETVSRRMQKFVRQEGHPPESQFPASRNKFLPGILRGIVNVWTEPLGEIQVTPAVYDVVGDQPRDGSDVAIPGPVGLIRVAVVAGTREDFFHRRRHGDCCLQCSRCLDRRVFSRGAIDLNHYDERDESEVSRLVRMPASSLRSSLIFRSNQPAAIVSELLPFAPANYRKFNRLTLELRLAIFGGFFRRMFTFEHRSCSMPHGLAVVSSGF